MTAHQTNIDDRAHRLVVSVSRALTEDRAGRGLGLNAAHRRQAKASAGIRLPDGLAALASTAWAADLCDVRLCLGSEADRFLDSVGAPACCVDRRVFLSRWAMADGERAAMAMAHELTHLATDRVPDVARGWDAAVHAELSELACTACRTPLDAVARAVGLSWGEFIQGVRNASSNMDIRQRVAHPVDTGTYLGAVTAGEGPRHGEGFNYTNPNIAVNAQRNIVEQVTHAHLAAREIMQDTPLFTLFGRSYRLRTVRMSPGSILGSSLGQGARRWEANTIGGVTLNEREWVKSLANSLHVAQDRGSHREGTKGYGHSDPRDGKMVGGVKWSCDVRTHEHSVGRDWLHCSEAAFNVGYNNSLEAIRVFLTQLGRLLGGTIPMPAVSPRADTCP